MAFGSIRRCILSVAGVACVVLATATSGWACASVGAVDVNPGVAQPGQDVAVKVTFVNKDKPVELRWDRLDGPALTTIDPSTFSEGLHGNWRFANGTITVPTDAKAGNHLVVASQEASRATTTWGMPARGLVQVSGGGSPIVGQQVGPAPVVRPTDLVVEKSASSGSLLLVGLGVAGLTMLVAGIGTTLASSRRRPPAAAAPARATR